jgi:TatD DNase family protein
VIDTHAHLDALDDPEAVLSRAAALGVSRVVTIGTGIDSCRAALALADAHEGVYAGLGIDPHQAATDEAGRVHELRVLLAHAKAVAVGEAGLDYHYGGDRRPEQCRLFEAQLELARELALPIVVHTREADDDTATLLGRHEGTVVMHCFSEPGLLEAGLELGWYFSFAGNVTYPKARELAFAAEQAPLDRMLVETDAPYLTPQVVRKERNQPAYVVHTARFIAERRGIAYEELEAAVHANSARLFGW